MVSSGCAGICVMSVPFRFLGKDVGPKVLRETDAENLQQENGHQKQ